MGAKSALEIVKRKLHVGRQSIAVGRRDVGHVGQDAPGEARVWPKGGRQAGPQQPEGTPDGEVHYEVFGW